MFYLVFYRKDSIKSFYKILVVGELLKWELVFVLDINRVFIFKLGEFLEMFENVYC